MGSINGLKTISATSIQNAGQFYLGNNLDSGTAGQVIISAGSQEAAVWGSNSATLPGALTMGTNLSLASGNASFDGTTADTINAAGLTITGGNGISVAGGTEILTDNDGTTINNSGGTGQQNQVLKVPNALNKGTNITFSAGTTYDGSAAITIGAVNTDTTYQGGTNISIDTTTNPDTINLDSIIGVIMINPITIMAFQQFSGATALIGNAAANPGYGTDTTYLDLSSALNITSPYCFHNVYGTASTDFDSLTTSYAAGSILGALGASIVAKQTALCVEVIVYNYAISSNRDTDMRLVDKGGSEWSVGTTEGGSGTGTIQTAREVHRADETDRQIVHQTWSITGLTIGSTYTFNPQAKTSSTTNFLAAGGNYPDAFFRGYYLPS